MQVKMMPHTNTTALPPKITKIKNVHWVILFSRCIEFCLIMIALHKCQLESIDRRRLPVATYFKNKIQGLNYKQIRRLNGQEGVNV